MRSTQSHGLRNRPKRIGERLFRPAIDRFGTPQEKYMAQQSAPAHSDSLFPPPDLLDELTRAFASMPDVGAVALGGSISTGNTDQGSDIDLYIYSDVPVPNVARRLWIPSRASRFEIDNRFWETGDEWDERDTGTHIDVMYRDFAGIRQSLKHLLEYHQAAIGYTTCLWHNIQNCRILLDRTGTLAQLIFYASRPYPRPLAQAIIAKNHPLLRDSFGAFGGQMLKAAQRGDWVSLNHRTAAFLGSYFDIVFAANLAAHPGEKRLLPQAAALPRPPAHMAGDIDALLTNRDYERLKTIIDSLVDNLAAILEQQDLTPEPHGEP
jgi:hypothetical protein